MTEIIIDLSPEEATGIPQLMGVAKKLVLEYIELQSYMLTKEEDSLGYSVSERRCEEIEKLLTSRQLRVCETATMSMMMRLLERMPAELDRMGIHGGFKAKRYFRD